MALYFLQNPKFYQNLGSRQIWIAQFPNFPRKIKYAKWVIFWRLNWYQSNSRLQLEDRATKNWCQNNGKRWRNFHRPAILLRREILQGWRWPPDHIPMHHRGIRSSCSSENTLHLASGLDSRKGPWSVGFRWWGQRGWWTLNWYSYGAWCSWVSACFARRIRTSGKCTKFGVFLKFN